jgi:hypothetical protein
VSLRKSGAYYCAAFFLVHTVVQLWCASCAILGRIITQHPVHGIMQLSGAHECAAVPLVHIVMQLCGVQFALLVLQNHTNLYD